MKLTTLTTVSTSTSSVSSSQQETRHKQRDKARKHRGRSVPIPGIWVNQGLGKIKLDEDVPAPVKMEINADSSSKATSEDNEGVTFTEEFTVTKEDVSLQSSEDPEEGQEDHSQKSSCSCRDEIESLKHSVKQLNLQVEKQNQVIVGIKSSLRNAVLSLMTCCQDEEEGGGQDFQESPVVVSTCSKVCGPAAEDPLLIENPDDENLSSAFEDASHSGYLQDSRSSISIEKFSGDSLVENLDKTVASTRILESRLEIPSASAIKSSSSNEVGHSTCPSTEVVVDVDDDMEDADLDDDDSSYVPNGRDTESDNDTEDDSGLQGNQLKSAEIFTTEGNEQSIRNSNSDSAANSEGSHRCSKCGKEYKVECHLCLKVFNHRSSLNHHISSTHEHVRYKCAHCPGTFSGMSQVFQHEKQVHVKGGPPTQQCKICGIHLVKSNKSLQVHMVKMHNKSRAKPLPEKKKPKEGTLKKKSRFDD